MNTSSRLEVIDQFRGFAMMMMVLANYTERIERVPSWLRHTPDIGLTVVDLGTPQHFLYFLPLPQGQGSFRLTF